MNIESELTKRIGAAGGKLHTARSRNDQVATDTRLYCREQIGVISDHLKALQTALLDKAEEYAGAVIPWLHPSTTWPACHSRSSSTSLCRNDRPVT